MDSIQPLFLFSLPRSGSTLLQKILSAHQEIESVSEPWLLLPQFYLLQEDGFKAEYDHQTAYTGIRDFIHSLPNQKEDYYRHLRTFICNLYQSASRSGHRYFLDKTPRYYHIIPFIDNVFPDAKFIFLFRNPASIVSSYISTWCNNRLLRIRAFEKDFTTGAAQIAQSYHQLKNKSILVNYEELIEKPVQTLDNVFHYLELSWDHEILTNYMNIDLKGNLGDPTGVQKYKTISNKSVSKWEQTIDSKVKAKVLMKILKNWDEHYFRINNCDEKEILESLMDLSKNRRYSLIDKIDYSIDRAIKHAVSLRDASSSNVKRSLKDIVKGLLRYN